MRNYDRVAEWLDKTRGIIKSFSVNEIENDVKGVKATSVSAVISHLNTYGFLCSKFKGDGSKRKVYWRSSDAAIAPAVRDTTFSSKSKTVETVETDEPAADQLSYDFNPRFEMQIEHPDPDSREVKRFISQIPLLEKLGFTVALND